MTLRHLIARHAVGLGLCAVLVPSAQSADPNAAVPVKLVSTTVQDEARKLPKDITAMLTRADRRVRLELVKLTGSGDLLAGANVTIVDPNGQSKTVTTDADGIATIEDAKPGLNAVVFGGEGGHGVLPLAVREASSDEAVSGPTTVRLPVINMDPNKVIDLARSSSPRAEDASYGDIDTQFVSTAATGDAFGFRIKLGTEGDLVGQVYSLVRGGIVSSAVEGTTVSIYEGSRLAGQATADRAGRFRIVGVEPGKYGLTAAGPGGYAAFGFEAYSPATIAGRSNHPYLLVSKAFVEPGDGDVMPVFLVPPPMLPAVVTSLERSYGPLLTGGAAGADLAGGVGGLGGLAGAGLGGIGAAGGSLAANAGGSMGAGGVSSSSVGGVGAAGGIGGLGGLAGIAGLGAAVAASSDDGDEPGIDVSPSSANISGGSSSN